MILLKLITTEGYNKTDVCRQFIGTNDNRLFYRYSVGSSWKKWYQFVLLPSGSDNKTFAAIGGAKTPVYVNADGVIVAGTAIKSAAYQNEDYFVNYAIYTLIINNDKECNCMYKNMDYYPEILLFYNQLRK